MKTTFPVKLQGSRYKLAEIQNDGFAACPYCESERECDETGLHTCLECGRTFEAVVKDVD